MIFKVISTNEELDSSSMSYSERIQNGMGKKGDIVFEVSESGHLSRAESFLQSMRHCQQMMTTSFLSFITFPTSKSLPL